MQAYLWVFTISRKQTDLTNTAIKNKRIPHCPLFFLLYNFYLDTTECPHSQLSSVVNIIVALPSGYQLESFPFQE